MSEETQLCVSLVDYCHDWNELINTFWHAWKSPPQATGELTFAHLGTGTEAEAQALADLKIRLLATAMSNPDTYWYKCVDKKIGKIIGGGSFTHHRAKTQDAPPLRNRLQATWFDEGCEKRQLSEDMYEQLHAWRRHAVGNREHAMGEAFWVVPAYRNIRAGKALVTSAMVMVDKLDVDMFVEGTYISTPLYLQFGFVVVGHANMRFSRENPGSEWKRLARDLQAHPVSLLWRPRQGRPSRDHETPRLPTADLRVLAKL